ncbi:unnamed protein product [Didymodactylos carnosus]|uniref:NADH dehydrogenase [ubiquinone] 1 alpha subcomplex subunit 6 n=1 Tax=Didymodactylos carnosus TaxID=1234261 RepID=A0A814XUR7_9BILA|nr:unnamed protein product [Didymodactylos carnosus]CAF1220563.1 unnamed protein product [Didymodactylos carnosus]CAF3805910.1 unnamed protein product [Didymodactylos carnosus]CAF3983971.1 unnamed protein product [Didymodactylos carnosus]
MALSNRIAPILKEIRPVLSVNHAEAKRRVLNLYKIWLRQIPYIRVDYISNNWTEPELRKILKDNFLQNKNVTDIRVIDRLLVKGQMDFVETAEIWRQAHNAALFDRSMDTYKIKPKHFLERFYEGHH